MLVSCSIAGVGVGCQGHHRMKQQEKCCLNQNNPKLPQGRVLIPWGGVPGLEGVMYP